MADRLATEQMGMTALVGVMAVPGVFWVLNGGTIGAKLQRLLIVGSLVAAAVALEATLDRSVNELVE